MKQKSKRFAAIIAIILCTAIAFLPAGCKTDDDTEGYSKNTSLDTSQDVLLRIVSGNVTWEEMDSVITKFSKIYPNCTVVYEYMEDYTDNLLLRLQQTEQKIDIFITPNILESTPYKEYALNLISEDAQEILDLSGANDGLVKNFRYVGAENTQYAIPFGGEMRGMYVNKTLLSQYDLEVPKNRAELLHCCEVLYAAGYIPFQSSTGTFAQQLLYPYICNLVVNGGKYEEMYAAIDNLDAGISEYFRDAYAFLYDIVEKGYYDYKRVEEELGYTFSGGTAKAMDFLNLAKVSEDVYEKQDDIGKIAFMPDTQSFDLYLSQMKSDYHSEIEYEFILSPVCVDGGVAYLSPTEGLAINNQSDKKDWALEFLNFFFSPEINTEFCTESGKVPNTADALLQYDADAAHTCNVGQMTFSNYNFYQIVTPLMTKGIEGDMVSISKNDR